MAQKETPDGIPYTDGFDFPVGPRGVDVDVFKTHKIDVVLTDPDYFNQFEAWHPGEDWNGRGGGDTDLGDPVYAIANGRVVEFGHYPVWGNIVLLEHALPDDTRVWSQYAHLNEIKVNEVGEKVNRGKQIGTIGKGEQNRYTAHLHFEIRKKKLPIGNWTPTVRHRRQVVESYYSPTEFISANRPKGTPTQPTPPITRPAPQPVVAIQVIVGPVPGNTQVGLFRQGGAGWQSSPGGFGSPFFWVPSSAQTETHWGEWLATLPAPGVWEIWAYVPAQNTSTTYARYIISHAKGQTEIPINQAGYTNGWAILGAFPFEPGRAAVRLTNFTGEFGPARQVSFDTVCWTRLGS
ncbi:MAG TPA: peptidoglycan DD-metalloendopeptidase family protein [Anaerolineae bacterium]|nr:peptidoglycan DD-metalloendopeptidase family protein [Anaerolineae bacterium]HMR67651.1 peptidoglycan DD-metalloendopeptidase family protein [Anaerolineae bacterium]